MIYVYLKNNIMSRETISIIIPVFNEQEIIEKSITKVVKLTESISIRLDTEIIIVNDGSNDNTLKILEGLKHKIKIISFTRNFGHQMAITAGIDLCKGNFVALLDADLQDPPKYIEAMLDICLQNDCEIVYGVRNERPGESFFKKITASIFYKILNLMSETEIHKNSGDFAVFTRKAANELIKLREKNRFVRGLIPWLGFKAIPFYYNRERRVEGKTKFTFFKMLKFSLDAIFSLSNKPLTFAIQLGAFNIILGIIFSIYFLYNRIFSESPVPGFTAIIISIILYSGIQIFLIGIVGSYIARIFEETKNRPLYVIDKIIELEKNDKT